jgi:mxaJ protein
VTLIEDDALNGRGEKMPQRFDQSVAVRRDDKALLADVDAALARSKPRIADILKAEGVPLLPASSKSAGLKN